MSPHLLLVAIGQYETVEREFSGIDGRTRPSLSFIEEYLDAEQRQASLDSMSRIPEFLHRLERQLGPYPGTAVGAVVNSNDSGYALETQDRPVFDGVIDDSTLLHELVHQWFGNSVTPDDWSDLWLAEGPAVFYEDIEALDVQSHEEEIVRLYRDEWEQSTGSEETWQIPMAGFTSPEQLFGDQVYRRSAMALGYLLDKIGGDEFSRFMRLWADHGRADDEGSLSTHDLLDLLDKETSLDVEKFSREWIYGHEKPSWD
jgi:aminopeptidase N